MCPHIHVSCENRYSSTVVPVVQLALTDDSVRQFTFPLLVHVLANTQAIALRRAGVGQGERSGKQQHLQE